MKREFLTISNLLSLTRLVLSIPFALLMLLPDPPLRSWATVLLLAAMLTDKLDGDIARWRGEETEWGRILDPLADKVGLAVLVLVLLSLGELPLWFVAALIGRDLLILAGGTYLKTTLGIVLPSNRAGKWTVGIISCTALVLMLRLFQEWQWLLLAVCTAGMLVSLVMYAARFHDVLRQARV
jgi:CDP-diacylglycerol--glycerol-3-phosphate 3-phosphatidyltransferase